MFFWLNIFFLSKRVLVKILTKNVSKNNLNDVINRFVSITHGLLTLILSAIYLFNVDKKIL